MLADAYVWTRVAACYGDDRPAPLALMATCAAARAAIEYSATGAVMRCGGVTVRRWRACVPGVPIYMQQQTCELWVDEWQRRTTPAVLAAASWWLLRMPPVVIAATTATTTVLLQPNIVLCVGAMHDGDTLPRADDDDDGAARPLDARVRGVRVCTRWRDVYARLCAVRVLRSDGNVDVSALRDAAAQLTVLQLYGRAARAALDWLPRCTRLQELTLLCDEQQPRERERDRVVDLCALTQLRKCELLADVSVEWRVDDAVCDVQLRTYCIVNRSVSSLAACTSLTLYVSPWRDIRHFRHATSKRMLRACARHVELSHHGYLSYTPDDATEDVYVHTRTSADLSWLARYPQLEYVRIFSYNDYNRDYSALAQLPRLRRLFLDVLCVDMRTLASCTRLEELTLRRTDCRVDNVSALASLPHLRKLSMCACSLQMPDVRLLYAHVEELDIVVDASPDSLAALPQLTRLRKLRIESSCIASFDVMSQCTQLQVLEQYYVWADYDLAVLPQLRELRIEGCEPVDFSKLARCHGLERLSVRDTRRWQMSDAPVVGTRLREMTVMYANTACINWIARHVYLEKLIITTWSDKNVNFGRLAALTRLREVHIDAALVRDICWVMQCRQLEVLVIVRSDIRNFSAIGALTQLRELVLYWMRPANISWLVRCTQLEYVEFSIDYGYKYNNNLSPVAQLHELRLCAMSGVEDEKFIRRIILLRSEAPASATRDGSAPVQYRFTHTITYRSD